MQKKLANDIIGVLASNVFTVVIVFLSGVLITRILGPAGSGRLVSIFVIPGLLIKLTLLGTRQSAIFHLGKKKYNDGDIVSSLIYIWIFSSVMAIIVSYINFELMHHEDLNLTNYLIVLSCIPLRLFIVYSISIFLGKAKFNYSNLFTLLPELLNFIIILIFVSINGLTVKEALVSYFFSSLLVALLCFYLLRKLIQVKLGYQKSIIRSLISLGLVNAVALFVMQLNYKIDIVFMYKYTNNAQVGIYSLGAGFAAILWQIPDAMGIIVNTRVANVKRPIKLRNELASLLRVSIIIGLIVSLIMYFIAPYAIPFIYGKAFSNSINMFRAILPGVFTFVIFRTLSGVFTGMGQPGILIKIFVPALIINIILNLIWIPLYGGIGAAWASNVSYSLGSIATLIVFSRKMKISLAKIFRFNINDFSFIINYVRIRTRKN